LPGERSKNGRTHLVPLSAASIELLDGICSDGEWPRRGYVFTTTGTTAVSGYSRAKRRLDVAISEARAAAGVAEDELPLPAWRVHDLRRTLATGFQRLGIRFEVTEAVLNHMSGSRGGVAGVYQRHDWAAEKADALARWSNHVISLAPSPENREAPGNLLQFPVSAR
jgi:integrase